MVCGVSGLLCSGLGHTRIQQPAAGHAMTLLQHHQQQHYYYYYHHRSSSAAAAVTVPALPVYVAV